MFRVTTNGTLKSYRANLTKSTIKLNDSINTVLSQRTFSSFAEDPAAAAKSFQLRRSYQRVASQLDVSNSTISKYQSAYSAMESVINNVDNEKDGSAWAAVLSSVNDTAGAGRVSLGQTLDQLADGIVQAMNTKYGETFIFAGADGHDVPFTWQENADGTRTLLFRGVDVNAAAPELNLNDAGEARTYIPLVDGTYTEDANGGYYMTADGEYIAAADYEQLSADAARLEYMSGETRYVDIGIGLQEDTGGKLIESSAFNNAIQGINFLGYGSDSEGDPQNIVSMIDRMGEILMSCDATTGAWTNEADRQEFMRLAEKFDDAASILKEQHTALSTEADFLNDNELQLKTNAYTINEQIVGLEQVDLADAITSYMWADYCYNAALASGKSILSETLMDYLS